ncbi:MAG: aminotransferase class V-fold PLP-dependent enzyme [Gomphosphaeria aponina SAG 52.96 = DSM 107014]|uniref:Aminotransferase class V-fold PLP-dependent enzyme n=1 Tax=Gomphosphaeria aponina SAG 52.96 = DSM 107014 TaxID=1521640 RepID=A0A941JS69_9CHRO|nr:aminotransferase class V-fold PLP-dependent enzyme [Gomphosphaeria aponina SAG 52.96 = DSM 107014]
MNQVRSPSFNFYHSSHWLLNPKIHFLNHGSFGATPVTILEYQNELRQRMELEPVRFLTEELEGLLDQARRELAAFLSTDADDLAFIPNATAGVNTILRSLSFKAGDEILITNHEYNACRNAVEFVANRVGAKVVIARVPFPLKSQEDVIEAILSKVSKKTKLALLDHVTSPTALIFPIKKLVTELAVRGVDTLVDGAHAPGFVKLNISLINPAYYTGNCHKWLCAPKGAAFLYVKKDKQPLIRPLAISHGANSPYTDRSRFRLEFDWTGTDDPTPYLCVPEAIKFMGQLLPGGWSELRQKNHTLAIKARKIICQVLNLPLPCPDEMLGSMASLPISSVIPDNLLKEQLMEKFNIQIPIIPWHSLILLRLSAQLYNSPQQYEYLAQSLKKILG